MPAYVAIHPRVRPITSTTITRSCDSAVVVIRSIASVAICTAVSNPNVTSVPGMSLSIVFGTPTIGMPSSAEPERGPERPVAADHDERVDPLARERLPQRRRALAVDVRVSPRRAEDRPAALQDPPHGGAVEPAHATLHQPVPAVEHADDLRTRARCAAPATTPRMTALRPGQSPPAVRRPMRAHQYRNIGLPRTWRTFGRYSSTS